MLVDAKIPTQFMKGPNTAVLKHFTAVRSELAPLVTSLWQTALAPAPLWPLIMDIVKISSTSDKPKKWFQGLNKFFKTSHTLSSTETEMLDGADTFTDLFCPLTEKEKGTRVPKRWRN